jgi:quinol monooxygenase YgiN
MGHSGHGCLDLHPRGERRLDPSGAGIGFVVAYGAAMRTNEEIRLVIEFAVDDATRFIEMAQAMAEYSKTEPGTRVYDWYVDADAGIGVLYEAYESFEAISAHATGPVFTEIAPKYADSLELVKVDVFGDAPQMEAAGNVLGAPTRFFGPSVAAITT